MAKDETMGIAGMDAERRGFPGVQGGGAFLPSARNRGQHEELLMKRSIAILAAGGIALAPAAAFAAPPASGSISPNHQTGQPGVECDEGTPPGNAGEPHGSSTNLPGSPFVEGDSVSGTHYAGEQPQNSKNTASVSQYDIACFPGPDRPSGG